MKSSKRVVRGRIDGQLLNGGKGGAFTITIIIKYGSLLLHFYTKRFIVNAYVMSLCEEKKRNVSQCIFFSCFLRYASASPYMDMDVFVSLSLTIQRDIEVCIEIEY